MTMDLADAPARYVRLHMRFGWSLLMLFLMLGIVLEAMHGFKVGWYLNAAQETRRLFLTLAHAHGVLLGMLNIVFAATLHVMPGLDLRIGRFTSPLLVAGCILLPTGFLLGGLVTYGGDPGLGVFLVGPGAALLVLAVALITGATWRSR